jgi:hypothetical protein
MRICSSAGPNPEVGAGSQVNRYLCSGLEDDCVTEAINRAIAGLPEDHQFTDAAAAALAASDQI